MAARKVLVVEDDVTIRETLVEVLADEGYEAVGASNGVEALARLEEPGTRPCLIVLDLMMPVMDGAGFREEQLRRPDLAEIPVVVLSAQRDPGGGRLGVEHVLRKPVRLADLLAITRTCCGATVHA